MLIPNSKAQLPINDPAWHIDTSLSDEFNESSINVNKWDTTYNYWDSLNGLFYNVNNGAEWDFNRNLIMTGTSLKIKADTLNPNQYKAWGTFPDLKYGTYGSGLTYAYQGGMIMAKGQAQYTFGYVEVNAKYPSKKYPLWPASWLWSNSRTYKYYNEIDFAENSALQSYEGNHIGNNYHVADTSSNYYNGVNGGTDVTLPVDSLSGGFHKFAVQWDPHRIIYYFDDVTTSAIYDPSGDSIPQNAMTLYFNFCVDPWAAYLPANWNNDTTYFNLPHHGDKTPTHWPQYLEINYVHYYTLNQACGTDLTICTPTDYSARKVQKSITVGEGTCTPDFNGADTAHSYTLRAVNYVILGAGTTINPTGTGYFAIDMTACP